MSKQKSYLEIESEIEKADHQRDYSKAIRFQCTALGSIATFIRLDSNDSRDKQDLVNLAISVSENINDRFTQNPPDHAEATVKMNMTWLEYINEWNTKNKEKGEQKDVDGLGY